MSSELDKFTYSTTYRQDYGGVKPVIGVDPGAESGRVECKPKVHVGEAIGRQYENTLETCSCRPGGSMSPRGAVASGLPNNLDKSCICAPTRPPTFNKEELAEMMYKAAESGNIKAGCCDGQNPTKQQEPMPDKFRPVPMGQFGGLYEGPLNRDTMDKNMTSDQGVSKFDKPCACPPGKPQSGPNDYGPAWIRERAEEPYIEPRMTGGNGMSVSPDVANLIKPEPPAARVSCAPEADVSKFDQPNTFMKKLYEKYPYLYQILRDTPPEELISRVFKDRFLSTYQVDYLHMGVGKEQPVQETSEKFVSPEGEVEPNMIPGCTYRPTKKGDFGKKKSTLKQEDRDVSMGEEPEVVVKEEPRISEYMASISKLGGEIITEKLYQLEAYQRKLKEASARNFG